MNYTVLSAFVIGIILFVLNVFLFPPQLSTELLLSPQWIVNEPIMYQSQEMGPALLLNDELLFINSNGTAGVREQKNFHLSFTNNFYVNASQVHETVQLNDRYGSLIETFTNTGFPLLFETAIAMITADGLGLEVWDAEGRNILEQRWASLITAVDIASVGDRLFIAVGLLDGRVYLFFGDAQLVIQPESADISPLYNMTLHVSGSQETSINLFSVEGFKPAFLKYQRFSIQEEGSIQRQAAHSIVLPSQPISLLKMVALDSDRANTPVLLLEEDGHVLKYHIANEQLLESGSTDGIGDFQNAWQFKGSVIYAFADASGAEIIMHSSNDLSIFSSRFSFALATAILENVIYMRSSSFVSATLLREG